MILILFSTLVVCSSLPKYLSIFSQDLVKGGMGHFFSGGGMGFGVRGLEFRLTGSQTVHYFSFGTVYKIHSLLLTFSQVLLREF